MPTRLVRLRAMRSLIWLLRRGGGPRFGAAFEVCGRSFLARVAGATRRQGRAALWLVCGFGAERCMSGRRPRSWWCVFGASMGLHRVGDGPLAFAVFRPCFPHKQGICIVFEPGLPYKMGQFYLLFELQDRPALFERFLKKKTCKS